MKPGLLRKLAIRFAFLIGGRLVARVFRPGFLGPLGTIHFARWVTVPGTGDLLFLSNYDGSWESYLEDFITRSSAGLTVIWSNTVGFPRTRNLFQGGRPTARGSRTGRGAGRSRPDSGTRPTPISRWPPCAGTRPSGRGWRRRSPKTKRTSGSRTSARSRGRRRRSRSTRSRAWCSAGWASSGSACVSASGWAPISRRPNAGSERSRRTSHLGMGGSTVTRRSSSDSARRPCPSSACLRKAWPAFRRRSSTGCPRPGVRARSETRERTRPSSGGGAARARRRSMAYCCCTRRRGWRSRGSDDGWSSCCRAPATSSASPSISRRFPDGTRHRTSCTRRKPSRSDSWTASRNR